MEGRGPTRRAVLGGLVVVPTGLIATMQGCRPTESVAPDTLASAAKARAIVMDGGIIVADGAIGDVLSDADLLAEHRLELPWGFVVPTR